ncbi:hypothetical protein D1818_18610 [Aquimarina sp. BL5]|uniref:hypothetical protein n=1 Tax=Aquimarina sp. BL5 TaxID=1714860 RepID=UPI000E521E30|nr:hypothetical protein [Aquimarina sp. BL5]AXT52737.1 hypothetical protein D1818_18610 [Aquimarina sp. BL5]RKM99998.1 hypothetical protein D7036_19375 [Aquimarina sp. BL5]
MIKKITLIGFVFLLVSCFPVETKNAEKAYKYWSRSEIPNEIELIKGEYYQSPHFSLEYELFLKFKSDKKWFDKFVKYNGLEIDTIRNDWKNWTELPEWFEPDQNFLIYAKDQTNEFERSRYLRNPETGISYIYETVGM